jgi:hypothetical protein
MKTLVCSCRHLEHKCLETTRTSANEIHGDILGRKNMETFVANSSKSAILSSSLHALSLYTMKS